MEKIEVEKNRSNARMEKIRFYCAQEILDNGGAELMKTIKINLKK
jgi:hydroxymethylbilane synthase